MRAAVPGDELSLRGLRLQALSDAPEAFGSTYERELARTTEDWRRWITPGVTFLLQVENDLRGLVAGVRDTTDAHVIHLMAMWTHPAVRGSGASDALVRALLGWARSNGARLMRLHVVRENDRARRFYQRHGFRSTGRETARDRYVELEMERHLDVNDGG